VDRLTDTGAGSGLAGDLRYCMTNATSGNDTITFGVTGTIIVQGPLPALNANVNIQGPGASHLTVAYHLNLYLYLDLFTVGSTAQVQVSGMTITGLGSDYGVVVDNSGTLTVSDSAISGNYSGAGFIGTIVNSGNLTVSNSTISDNSGVGIKNSGSATINYSTLSGNNVFGGYNPDSLGGGIFNTGNLTVNNSTISGNKVTAVGAVPSGTGSVGGPAGNGMGGGIYMGGGMLSINSSTLAVNQAIGGSSFPAYAGPGDGLGGGLYIARGMVSITNSTLAGNQATGGWVIDGHYTPELGYGGGIYNAAGASALQMHDTILADNTADTGPDLDGGVTSLGYSLIGNTAGGSGFGASDLLNVNPRFGPLQNNGGPTQTMALLPGSPALNAGDPTQLGVADQRGVVRTGGVNIGAYQASASALLLTGPSSVTAGVPFAITVQAVDPFGQTAVGYAGTVHFVASNGAMADYTFTAADGGQHTFSNLVLRRAGTLTVAGTDTANASITGGTALTITPAAASQLLITAPSSVNGGVPFNLTVTALDAYGNAATGYAGTVHFSSTDPSAALPADYTFTAADEGVATFPGLVLGATGNQTITITDTQDSSLTASVVVDVL
jgi:hypothetical protein